MENKRIGYMLEGILIRMDEITFKEYMKKSGFLLQKYRINLSNIMKLREEIENKFILADEMVDHFYANKSEYYAWQELEDSIINLEDAYNELVGNMMDAKTDPSTYKYYLKDQRIPVLVQEEEGEGDTEEEELLDEETADKMAKDIAKELIDELGLESEEEKPAK